MFLAGTQAPAEAKNTTFLGPACTITLNSKPEIPNPKPKALTPQTPTPPRANPHPLKT